MNPSDINAVLQWWLVLFLLGAAFAPVTFRLFAPFFDKGYLFSRMIGLLMVGYVVFVLGTFHIAKFTTVTIIIVAIILSAGSFFLLKPWWKFWHTVKELSITFVIEEVLFLVVLFI